MSVYKKINTAEPGAINVPSFTDAEFADVLTDALVTVTYIPKLVADKDFSKALATLLLVIDTYGENFTEIFRETWNHFKGLSSERTAAIWELVKVNYDLPVAYDEYELKVEKIARLPILSAGQINDIVKLVSLLLTKIEGKNFFEAVGAIFAEFQTLSHEFADTLAVIREWVALVKETRPVEG